MRVFLHDNYGISKRRYQELYAFCRQYGEWQRALQECYRILPPVPHAVRSSDINDPTAVAAIREERLSRNIELVERTAKDSAPDIARYILQNVTQGLPYERLTVPAGRRQFYTARRRFFWLLDRRR